MAGSGKWWFGMTTKPMSSATEFTRQTQQMAAESARPKAAGFTWRVVPGLAKRTARYYRTYTRCVPGDLGDPKGTKMSYINSISRARRKIMS